MTDLRELHAEELAHDRRARRVAQTEFDRPVLLEAGAGTGKTTTLVARSLVWCLGRGWSEAAARLAESREGEPAPDRVAGAVLEGLVAITFTEAAAAEMASRVAEALATVARGGSDEELVGIDLDLLPEPLEREALVERARALLGALDRLEVRTIHAFCHRLLVTWALEAGLHPEFRIDADGFEIEEIAAQVVEDRVRAAYARGRSDDPLVVLAALGHGPREVAEVATELAREAFPAEELGRDPFAAEASAARLERLERRLTGLIEQGGERLVQAKRSGNAVLTIRAAQATLAALDELGEPGVEEAERLRDRLCELWPKKCLDRLREWSKGTFNQSETVAVGDAAAAVSAACGPLRRQLQSLVACDPRQIDAARRALAPILEELEGELRRAGLLSFATILDEAVRLLATRASARDRERRRIQQLLVDEFQDTDRRQCELVRRLALEGPEEERPGLFVVGDPKQTIYGWRNADLEAYEAFAAAAEAAGGQRWALVENFRSSAPLLEEVERAVAPVMIESPGLQPSFEPLLPCLRLADDPGFEHPGRAPIEHWTSCGPQGPQWGEADEAARLEATAVAADIADLVRSGAAGYGDFGLLLRASTRVDTYLEALRAAGVPFAVMRDRQYYRRREIVEAAATVRAILHPADHLALVGWLRSSSVGVPDAAWIPLWKRDFPRLATELEHASGPRWEAVERAVREAAAEVPAGLPGLDRLGGWERSLLAALAGLAELRQAWRELPVDRFLDRLRARLLPEPSEAARFLGAYRQANLERFYRRLGEALTASKGDSQVVLRALRRALDEQRESTESRPMATAEAAVQVLTIHAAKGLEFEHLYLVQAGASTGGGRDRRVDLDETRRPDRVGAYTLFGLPGPDYGAVRERRDRVEAAERVRTLYVALTRARRRLVVVGQWPGDRATHLELLRPRRNGLDAGERTIIEALEPGESHLDPHGALWRRLDPEAPPAMAPAVAEGETLPAAAEARRLAAESGRNREAARRHAARPFLRAASDEAGARLARVVEIGAGGTEAPGPLSGDDSRRVALAVGEAVHRLFETWDHAVPPDVELARQRERVEPGLAATLPPALVEAGTERAARLLARLEAGSLLERFVELGPTIIARELPLVLPADAAIDRAGDDGNGTDAPVGAWTGAIDLLYRDPDSGLPVVVDFKTDEVEGEEALAARAAAYAPQEAVYREAVRQAFGLDEAPPFELWFLWMDRVWASS